MPNLQDVRGWSIWINQQHTSWHRSYSRQCHDGRRWTYKLYQNVIRKSVTHSFSHNGCWNTMPSTIYLQHVSVGPKLYNQQRTFQSEWRTDHARYQSAVSQEHDAGRQPILRLPRHDAKHFTYRTWVFHRWVNRSLTYRVIQDNATGYGKRPILRSTRVQCWTPAGGHSTVPGIRSIECQSCTNEWIFDAPFGPEQAGRCQAPIIVVTCYACQSTLPWKAPPGGHEGSVLPCQAPFTALLHEVRNRSWLINLPKSYRFIYPNPPHPVTWGIIPVGRSKNNKNSIYIWNDTCGRPA